jgi:chromosome segregation ATPase
MPKLLDTLLSRPDPKLLATPEQLRRLAEVAQKESGRLSELVRNVEKKLTNGGHLHQSIASIENRLQETAQAIQEVEPQLKSFRSLAQLAETMDKQMQHLNQRVAQTDEKLTNVEERKAEADQALGAIRDLLDASKEAEQKLETIKAEAGNLNQVNGELKRMHERLDRFQNQLSAVDGIHENLKNSAQSLQADTQAMQEQAGQIKDELERAADKTSGIQPVIEALTNSEELSRKTEEQLHNLNALCEHVSHKLKSLRMTKELVDKAQSQSVQVNELIWDMEQKLKAVQEEKKLLADVDGDVEKLQELQEDFRGAIETTKAQKTAFMEQGARLKDDLGRTLHLIQEKLENTALFRQELEVTNQRIIELQNLTVSFEEKFQTLTAKDQEIQTAVKNAEVLSNQLNAVRGDVDGLHERVQTLSALEQRLEALSQLSTKVTLQVDQVNAGRCVAEDTEKKLTALTTLHGEIQAKLETLNETHQQLSKSQQLFTDFRKASLDAESDVKQIMQRLAVMEDVKGRIMELQNLHGRLDEKIQGLDARGDFVKGLESKLDDLNELSQSVDHRIGAQLTKKQELDSMRAAQESLALQLADLHKLAASLKNSKALAEMEERTGMLEGRVETLHDKLQAVEHLERLMREREGRTQDLTDKLEDVTGRIEEQSERLTAMGQEVERVNERREQWLQEVGRVETRQRELHSQSGTIDAQLDKASELLRELGDKNDGLALTEKKLTQYETRLNTLENLLQGVDEKIGHVESRRVAVDEVKRQVETLFDTCERTRNDALSVVEARKDVVDAKEKLDQLMKYTAELGEQHHSLETRKKGLQEAELKIEALNNLMCDIELNLENFQEQKAIIDHVAEKVNRLEFAVKKAEIVTQELHAERELAGRIQKGIQSLRKSRSGLPAEADTEEASLASQTNA